LGNADVDLISVQWISLAVWLGEKPFSMFLNNQDDMPSSGFD
jgi:hypothetical protein